MQQAKQLVPLRALEEMRIIQFDSLQAYLPIYEKMRAFTLERLPGTLDEIWLLEHHSVFTLGQAGKAEHIVQPATIPVIQSDRGGQITYHGPGQLMIYVLLDLNRLKINIRELIDLLDRCIITLLAQYNIIGHTKPNAPGIYINDAKIASIGLRVRKGCSYHGICLNVEGDLSPFLGIHPCGYKDLAMTQMKHHNPNVTLATVSHSITFLLKKLFTS